MGILTVNDAMHLNRHERRRLAKINSIDRIPGVNISYKSPKREQKRARLNKTGTNIR